MGNNLPQNPKPELNLLIISNMAHFKRDGQVVGWGPTVQEIDAFSTLFKQVRHIGCMHPRTAPASALPYQATNIEFVPLPPAGGDTLQAKLDILNLTPMYLRVMARELDWADIVHVRCPANIPLLALFLLMFRNHPKYRWFKYAGNWNPQERESWSYTFQRWILRKNFLKGIVTINGHWVNQSNHLHSFLNPSLLDHDIEAGHNISVNKNLKPPYNLLFVGRLDKPKGILRILEIATALKKDGILFDFHICGDGPERNFFENLAIEMGLSNIVYFHGWVAKTKLHEYYSKAHFLILPSNSSEGWPKVLSEGMAYGAVPLAGAISAIPQILAEAGSGLALPPLDVHAFVQAIQDYISDPQRWQTHSQAGITFAPQFSYYAYLDKLRQTFRLAWNMEV
jgi:glycosyltransferase involved in cell wall biosynthesis